MSDTHSNPLHFDSETSQLAAGLDRLELGVRSLLARDITSRERISALEREVEGQDRKLAAAEQQVRQVSEAANVLQKRNEEVRRTLEGLEQHAGGTAMELERVRHDADARLTEVQSLTDALSTSQREAEELRVSAESLRHDRDDARRALADADALQTEMDALREERAILRGERDEARALLETAEQETGSYAGIIAQRDAVIAAREEEINQCSVQIQQAADEAGALRQSLDECRSELATMGERQADSKLPLFSDEERAEWTARIRELVVRLDRHLTV
jgi:chromosome segregation ATPase